MSTQTNDVVQKFEQFYQNYYQEQVLTLANAFPRGQKSLEIDWQDLFEFDSEIAEDYLNHPQQMREYAEEALRIHDIPNGVDLSAAHVRITNVNNNIEIRELRADNVNQLLTVEGIVRNNTDVRPKILDAAFECKRCGTITRIPQSSSDVEEPHECKGCDRDGPFGINYTQSTFIDSQALRVQESPEGLRGGETPQNIDVRFHDDMVGKVSPGNPVEVTGILRLEDQSGQDKSTTFDMYIEGVSLRAKDEKFEDFDLSENDKEKIRERSELPDVYEAFTDSIAPSIYGYPKEKLAIMLQLFGGYTKHLPDDSRIRGDLHILLIGDPGTGKSQLLQYIRNVAPRSVYASGKGSSTAGLTAAAVRVDMGDGSEWTLEAGTLVLADKGIAAIDELDKMSPEDRSALHEGLEQQEITVSKAGINATLKSRCALLGAANPKYGRFDEFEGLAEQIDLDPALISRFDLIFTITDKPNEEKDRDLARHIINSNFAGQLNTKKDGETVTDITDGDVNEHIDNVDPEIDSGFFRKYIAYAKQTCFPELTQEARDHIEDFYVDLRLEGTDDDAPVPVTARKLEALVRLAEASARVRLSDEATIEDAKRATTLAQSSLEDIGIDPETGNLDADIMATGKSKSQRERVKSLCGIISELEDNEKGAKEEEVFELAKSTGMDEHQIKHQLSKLLDDGEIYQPSNGYYRNC